VALNDSDLHSSTHKEDAVQILIWQVLAESTTQNIINVVVGNAACSYYSLKEMRASTCRGVSQLLVRQQVQLLVRYIEECIHDWLVWR
jgi:hypothetical protein